MSVGLGNIWRFPFTAFENGGGAFLIPYIVVLVVVGRPLYYLEMAIGQFASKGSVQVWELAPLMKGMTKCILNKTIRRQYFLWLQESVTAKYLPTSAF